MRLRCSFWLRVGKGEGVMASYNPQCDFCFACHRHGHVEEDCPGDGSLKEGENMNEMILQPLSPKVEKRIDVSWLSEYETIRDMHLLQRCPRFHRLWY